MFIWVIYEISELNPEFIRKLNESNKRVCYILSKVVIAYNDCVIDVLYIDVLTHRILDQDSSISDFLF